MGKPRVAKDVPVGCNRPRGLESRDWIGWNANTARDHRRIDVCCPDLTPIRSIVEVNRCIPMMRKLMFHCELTAKGGYLGERLCKLPKRTDLDRTGNGRLRILETRRVDRRFLLTDSIQPVDLQCIAWIHRGREQSCSQVNHPGRFAIGRPVQAETRRKVRKAAGRGLKLIAEA